MWVSVPQMAAAFTLTSRSLGPGWGIGQSVARAAPAAAWGLIMARIVPFTLLEPPLSVPQHLGWGLREEIRTVRRLVPSGVGATGRSPLREGSCHASPPDGYACASSRPNSRKRSLTAGLTKDLGYLPLSTRTA